ncbi:hypothetical protein BJ742DRAFT_838776 [Cladochytrium replicatum]|nr:hypothetical protein BJ742DRAFT_838776 [Cladochytrium replicatum]
MATDIALLALTAAALACLAFYVFNRTTMKPKAADLDGFPWSKKSEEKPRAPFGALLGTTDGDVQVYSSNYDTLDPGDSRDPAWFDHYIHDQYCGYKWQCVELARRYLILNRGMTFDSVPMAYDIFDLKTATRVSDGQKFPFIANPNGDWVPPEIGSLLIWEPVGEFRTTGHVAVIVTVASQYVDIVEQNVEDVIWPDGIKYSRRLHVTRSADGSFTIHCTYPDTVILGWKTIQQHRSP